MALTVIGLTAVLLLICLELRGAALMATPFRGENQGLSLSLVEKSWTGDYDGMVKRRQFHVLVVNSKTFYFVDKGTQRGTAYDLFKPVSSMTRVARSSHNFLGSSEIRSPSHLPATL